MFNIIINQHHYLMNKGFFNNTISVSGIPWYDPIFYLIYIFYINIILWFRGSWPISSIIVILNRPSNCRIVQDAARVHNKGWIMK